MIKILKMTGIIVAGVVLLLVLIVVMFLTFSPQIGGKPSGKRLAIMEASPQYKNGKFVNSVRTQSGLKDWREVPKLMYKFFKKKEGQEPDWEIPVNKIDSSSIVFSPDTVTNLTWFGHSAFLLEMDGMKILIDPMLGDVPSPVPIFGNKRFNLELPIDISQLPEIDAIIYSHDHYDHLDYGSVKALKEKTKHYYVPLGVGVHLEEWGVPASRITELDWWQQAILGSISLTATPARHFSGRSMRDGNGTLWASWVIKGSKDNIYFTGDSGYFDGFEVVGEKYGPFDLALVECGQYNDLWPDIHMKPEQSAQVGIDVKAKAIMPIHWGAFKLALHSWTDPIERVTAEAKKLGVHVLTPEIGERFAVSSEQPKGKWWNK